MKKNNNQYILLLLCVLLIFILIIKNKKEHFQLSYEEEKDKWQKNSQEKFDRQEEELNTFITNENINITTELKMILDLNYNDIINDDTINIFKDTLRVLDENREQIHFIYKLAEKEEDEQLHIYFASIIILYDQTKNNNNILISKKIFNNQPSQILPNVNLIPEDDEKYEELNKKFEKKIGPLPDPKECVIS